jgi:thiamine kinase-like enzyme
MEQPDRTILIEGVRFHYIKTRDDEPVEIYEGPDAFLRIGPESLIAREMESRQKLLQLGFPVPIILASGKLSQRFYFTEQSLGKLHLGEIFSHDYKRYGKVTNNHFRQFLAVIAHYSTAQIKEIVPPNPDAFLSMIHAKEILSERPDLRSLTEAAIKRLQLSATQIPSVLSHGDLNPHNLFPTGCIDFERLGLAPAGYDLITAIYHVSNFPKEGNYERRRAYSFTGDQISAYISKIDSIYIEAGLRPPSNYINDMLFARLLWSATRLNSWPNLQAWRYRRYEEVLAKFVAGEDIRSAFESE